MWVQVGKLNDHWTTHGVTDQRDLLDSLGVKEGGGRMRESGHSERLYGVTAPAESRKVGH